MNTARGQDRVRTALLFGGALLCLAVASYNLSPILLGAPEPVALARISPTSHDFGEARQNQTLTHEFRLENISEGPIEIAGIHTTCRCTEIPKGLLGKVFQPGESLAIPLSISTGVSTDETGGVASFFLRPLGDKENISVVKAPLSAKVVPEYRLDPPRIDFGEVSDVASTLARHLTLVPLADKDAILISARSSNSCFVATIDKNGDRPELVVSINEPSFLQQKRVSGRIQVTTSSSAVPISEVTVEAFFRPAIALEPPELVFVAEPGGSNSILQLLSRNSIQLISAKSPTTSLACTLDTNRMSTHHTIAVKCTSKESGNSTIDITGVTSDDRSAFTVHVPVHVLSKGAPP